MILFDVLGFERELACFGSGGLSGGWGMGASFGFIEWMVKLVGGREGHTWAEEGGGGGREW